MLTNFDFQGEKSHFIQNRKLPHPSRLFNRIALTLFSLFYVSYRLIGSAVQSRFGKNVVTVKILIFSVGSSDIFSEAVVMRACRLGRSVPVAAVQVRDMPDPAHAYILNRKMHT